MKAIIKMVRKETPTVKSFQFEPEKPITYKAGQWIYFTVPTLVAPDERGPRRQFTLSSSPSEGNLQITTRISESGFKQSLNKMKPGDGVEISSGAFGKFCLEEQDTGPWLFLAGGIGITPFRSILKTVAVRNRNIDVVFLYSVHDSEDIIFANELKELDKLDSINIKIFTERLNPANIRSGCPDFLERTTWICGPPAMVEATVETGVKMNIPNEKLRSEELSGY